MADARPHVLIAGLSTRALAASAARAGYRVTAVDAFGDADLRAVAYVLPLRRDGGAAFSAGLAAEAARASDAGLAAYTSSFENAPGAVAALARGRRLLGNGPAVLERVRNPIVLMRALAARGFPVPVTRASAPPPSLDARRWLLKPRHSGGGHGVSPWRRGRPVGRRAYLQERIAGVPGSVIFAADGRRAVTLGITRQLVGERAFGARGFRYCGSLLASRGSPLFEHQAELLERATALAAAAAEAFELRGVNTVDFVARRGVPYPIEVNPRYSASMELVERATGASLFALHVQASGGRLPRAPSLAEQVFGKAIVYARQDVVVDEPASWTDLGDPDAPLTDALLADVPHPGERIARGRPICTVFAAEPDAVRCVGALEAAAAAIYRATAPRATADLNRGAA
ncbi:MAG: ATP-grasp domain-containing protein [Gemmatimonadales bacterium]|nr:ATP-grasp domain-containing protein [Gemmatimonadales bacterium]